MKQQKINTRWWCSQILTVASFGATSSSVLPELRAESAQPQSGLLAGYEAAVASGRCGSEFAARQSR